jgi:hypothetical protein
MKKSMTDVVAAMQAAEAEAEQEHARREQELRAEYEKEHALTLKLLGEAERLKQILEQREQELMAWAVARQALEVAYEKEQAQAAALRDEAERLKQSLEEQARADQENLRAQYDKEHSLALELLGETERLKQALEGQKQEHEALGAVRQELRAARARLETAELAASDLEELRRKVTTAERTITELRLAYETSQQDLFELSVQHEEATGRLQALRQTEEDAAGLRQVYQQYQVENDRLRIENRRLEADLEQLPPLKQAVSELRDETEHSNAVAYEEHMQVERLEGDLAQLRTLIGTNQELLDTQTERVRSMSAMIEQKNQTINELSQRLHDEADKAAAALQDKGDEVNQIRLLLFAKTRQFEEMESYYKQQVETLDAAVTRLETNHNRLVAGFEELVTRTDTTREQLEKEINRLNQANADLTWQLAEKPISLEFQEAYETELVEHTIRAVTSRGGFIYEVNPEQIREQVLRDRGYIRDNVALKSH